VNNLVKLKLRITHPTTVQSIRLGLFRTLNVYSAKELVSSQGKKPSCCLDSDFQGHPSSMIFMSFESQYATSY